MLDIFHSQLHDRFIQELNDMKNAKTITQIQALNTQTIHY